MKNLKKLVSIAAALVVLLSLAVPLAFADEGTSTGQFTAQNADPTVTSVALVDTGDSPVTAMTPQVEYNVKVTVSDANTLDDLSTVTVRIFYDADGS